MGRQERRARRRRLLNQLLLGTAAAGAAVSVPQIIDNGLQLTDPLALLGFAAALVWKSAPDEDDNELPDFVERWFSPPAKPAAPAA